MFAFAGGEIVTIAAAESSDPGNAVARAVNSVVARVLVFYVVSIALIVTIVPWTSVKVGSSPFAAALDRVGIPGAGDVMAAVILTAVLSCLNSGLYTGSRMLFALADNGDAPAHLKRVNRRGVPVWAILLTTSVGFASIVAAYISPTTVFLLLVNSAGAIVLVVYVMIAISELRFRSRLRREASEQLKLRMWLFPWLSIAAMILMAGALVSMAFIPAVRAQLLPSTISVLVVLGIAWTRQLRGRRNAPVPLAAAAETPAEPQLASVPTT